MLADLKDHFLNTPMERPEYMKVPYNKFPDDIRTTYNLDRIVTSNGYIFYKIKHGMHGLKQADILAYDYIKQHLYPYGYHLVPGTVGLWKHSTRPISCYLCVDDFGIKCFNKENINHLLDKVGNLRLHNRLIWK